MPTEPSNPQHHPWKLPVLVPLWLIQIVLGVMFLIASPIIASASTWRPGMDSRGIVVIVFTGLSLLIVGAEIGLFVKKRLDARTYMVAQWVKATLAGTSWVVMEVFYFLYFAQRRAGDFAFENFIFQHPAIIASLYYASRVYSKYGGNAGRDVIRQDEEGEGEREGDEEERPNDETTPLLRDGAEEA